MTLTMTISNSINNDCSSSYTDNQLDSNFIAIDWQAPWLYHLNQLDYLSQTIKNLRGCNDRHEQQKALPVNQEKSVDIIAQVLNEAVMQQSKSQQTALPATKPTVNNQAHPLIFVAQEALPEGIGYEQFIATTGNIPTRNNLHDLFNGSIWLTFAKTKALLNYYHMLEIAKQDSSESRGRVRDTITVFDENGAVFVTSDPSLGKALIDFDWQASLVTPCAHFDNPYQLKQDAQAAVYIFGHALLEQLIQPRKALCAHSVVINVESSFFDLTLPRRMEFLDKELAEYMDKLLSQVDITPRQLAPLPILGIPHFWPENVNPSFYEDAYVFRNGRRKPNRND